MRSKISILMANYNKSKYLETAIDSVINQTCPDWELIIVDDCSQDKSPAILGRYAKLDRRVKVYYNEKNYGTAYTQNRLVKLATAKIVGILDSDDGLDPYAVEAMLNAYHNNPGIGFIYSQFAYTDPFLHPYKIGECGPLPPGQSNLTADCISHFKTFYRNLYFLTEGYRSDLSPAEDMDMVLKLEEQTPTLFVNKVLYYYRMLPSSFSHGNQKGAIGRLGYLTAVVEAFQRRKITGFPSMSKLLFIRRVIEGIYLAVKLRDNPKLKLFLNSLWN